MIKRIFGSCKLTYIIMCDRKFLFTPSIVIKFMDRGTKQCHIRIVLQEFYLIFKTPFMTYIVSIHPRYIRILTIFQSFI
ncbi:hypothetical protein K27_00850 [Klebsiella pneumoniae]|nr:hypothetical protein K27_00850 [Klebsiella pneumoniae]HBY4863143.1 hypothetical protein [Klebsiella pneumoniae]